MPAFDKFKGVSFQLKEMRARKLVIYCINQTETVPRAQEDAAAFVGKRRDTASKLQLFRKGFFAFFPPPCAFF